MKLRYFFVVFLLFFFAPMPQVFAHPGLVDEKGCHECRTEDGCFFYDYFSVPYTMRHCHPELRATSSVALAGASIVSTSSASSTVVGEDEGKSFFASLLSPASWFRSLPRVAQFLLVLFIFSLLYIFWRLFRRKEEE